LLYAFNLFQLEWRLIPYFANLMVFGWSLGMIATALILRWGQAAETLAWAIPFMIQPFSAVYYAVDVLPPVMQSIAWLIPSTYVFESMRSELQGNTFQWQGFFLGTLATLLWMALAAWIFTRTMRAARERGLLTRIATQ
jgi:ABC-2 type transport system permease protein